MSIPRHAIHAIHAILLSALVLMMSGCASIRSTKLPDNDAIQGGLIYYLPTQRLKLTMTIADGTKGAPQTRTITVTPTDVFADQGQRYVAQYRRNQIGTNTLKVSVNNEGLLSGDNEGSSKPQFAEFLGRIGSEVGTLRSLMAPIGICAAAGTYEWIFDAPSSGKSLNVQEPDMDDCGLTVVASAPTSASSPDSPQSWRGVDRSRSGHGFFYRQKRPVQVMVTSGNTQRKAFQLAVVDANSPTEYLPIPRTLFADTIWKVNFTNGSPTLYDVSAGGDTLGLVKLPADVMAAYSKAALAGLKDKKDLTAAESEYLKQLVALAAQQAKFETCQAALQSDDIDKIKAACN
jgi:uncharacterized protein YceK